LEFEGELSDKSILCSETLLSADMFAEVTDSIWSGRPELKIINDFLSKIEKHNTHEILFYFLLDTSEACRLHR